MYKAVEILLAEIIEKTVRTEAFINSVKEQASSDDINIIRIYENVIESIKNDLIRPSDILKSYHGKEIPAETLELNINSCRKIFLRINQIHILLGYLQNVQCRKETYTLLKYLLEYVPPSEDKKVESCVILSDIYNYAEINFVQILKDGGVIESEFDENQIILDLPKIEKENPLMWTSLAHEIGHVLDRSDPEITNNIFNGIKLPPDHLRILKKWTKEIVADMISIKIMGPSSMLSSIFFNLCTPNLGDFNNTHPSVKYRLSVMESMLSEKFEMDIINEFEILLDELQTFDKASSTKVCEECGQVLGKNIFTDYDQLIPRLDEYVEKGKEIIEQIMEEEFTKEQYNHSIDLAEILKTDIPINSSRKLDDDELKELYESIEPNQDNIYELLKNFEEKPNSISEIISAGWMNKIKNIFPTFIELFLEDDDKTFNQKYAEYRDFLNKKDNLLLKSIEIADIHSLFELGRTL